MEYETKMALTEGVRDLGRLVAVIGAPMAIVFGVGLGYAALTGKLGNSAETSKGTSLTKPAGCETVKDIRYLDGHHDMDKGYQLLCEEQGKTVLYTKGYNQGEWHRISVQK